MPSAESIMHKHGVVAVIVHKDQLDRDEKEVLRDALYQPESKIMPVGDSYVLVIPEEPTDYFQDGSESEVEAQEQVASLVMPPNTPTVPDELEGLTVAQLKELADNEEIDISDVKLKADIVGRIWGVREMREQEG